MKTKRPPSFRHIEKEAIGLKLPVPIASALRVSAAKTRRSLNDIASEALADHLGLDPIEFGIEPKPEYAAT